MFQYNIFIPNEVKRNTVDQFSDLSLLLEYDKQYSSVKHALMDNRFCIYILFHSALFILLF